MGSHLGPLPRPLPPAGMPFPPPACLMPEHGPFSAPGLSILPVWKASSPPSREGWAPLARRPSDERQTGMSPQPQPVPGAFSTFLAVLASGAGDALRRGCWRGRGTVQDPVESRGDRPRWEPLRRPCCSLCRPRYCRVPTRTPASFSQAPLPGMVGTLAPRSASSSQRQGVRRCSPQASPRG